MVIIHPSVQLIRVNGSSRKDVSLDLDFGLYVGEAKRVKTREGMTNLEK